jgi:hypothetical protein
LKWEQALFGGKMLRAPSLEKMTTPFKSNYAFGLQVDTASGRKLIDHGGGIEGFNTQLSYYPEDKLIVVVLRNVNGLAPGAIATKLAALSHGENVVLPGERKEITLDTKTLSRYVGAYEMRPGVNMLVTLQIINCSRSWALSRLSRSFRNRRPCSFRKWLKPKSNFRKKTIRESPAN